MMDLGRESFQLSCWHLASADMHLQDYKNSTKPVWFQHLGPIKNLFPSDSIAFGAKMLSCEWCSNLVIGEYSTVSMNPIE